MLKKFITPLLAAFLCSSNSFAQLRKASSDLNAGSEYPISVSFQPIFLLNNTFRLDADIQKKDKASALNVGLEVIAGNPEILYYYKNGKAADDMVNGVGLSLGYKLKLNSAESLSGFYFSPGIALRTLKIGVTGEEFYSYTEDGLEYITYGEVTKKYPVQSALIFTNLGFHKVFTTHIVFDSYVGFGYKTSTRNDLLEANRNYEKPIYGFNFNGFTFLTGFKIGYQIKK